MPEIFNKSLDSSNQTKLDISIIQQHYKKDPIFAGSRKDVVFPCIICGGSDREPIETPNGFQCRECRYDPLHSKIMFHYYSSQKDIEGSCHRCNNSIDDIISPVRDLYNHALQPHAYFVATEIIETLIVERYCFGCYSVMRGNCLNCIAYTTCNCGQIFTKTDF